MNFGQAQQSPRWLNFRPLLVVSVWMIFYNLAFWLLLTEALLGLLGFFVLTAVLLTRISAKVFSRDYLRLVTFVVALVCCALQTTNFVVRLAGWTQGMENGALVSVGGLIADGKLYDEEGEFATIYLDHLELDGRAIEGKMRVFVKTLDKMTSVIGFLRNGWRLSFDCYIEVVPILDSEFAPQNYISDIRYVASISESDLTFAPEEAFFLEAFRNDMRDIIYANMEQSNAGIITAMLLGDSAGVDPNLRELFTMTGIVHVLSVSGMHFTLIIMVIAFLLNKLKVNSMTSFLVISVLCFMYAALTQFSPYVLRAFIMGEVQIFSKVIGRRNDDLSSLSFALVLMLLFCPFFLYNVSFLLSFCAMLGIMLFSRPLSRLLTSAKVPSFVATPIAASVSAQISVVPLSVMLFGEMPTYFVLANVVITWLLSVVFVASIFAVILVYAFGFLSPLLWGINALINLSVSMMDAVASLPYAVIFLWPPLIYFLLFLPIMFFASKYLLRRLPRRVMLVLACFILVFMTSTSHQPSSFRDVLVPVSSRGADVVYLGTDAFIVGRISKTHSAKTQLLNWRIGSLKGYLATELELEDTANIDLLSRKFGFVIVYVPLSADPNAVFKLRDIGLSVVYLSPDSPIGIGEYTVEGLYVETDFCGYALTRGDFSLLITSGTTRYLALDQQLLNGLTAIRSRFNSEKVQTPIQLTNHNFGEYSRQSVHAFDFDVHQYFRFEDSAIIEGKE